MAFTCTLSPSATWDVVAHVRNVIEDTSTTPVIPDAALESYVEVVNEDFSTHIPLDYLVGNPATASSPMTTVQFQQRYVCNTANGFTPTPMQVTDVLYQAGTGYSAASEIAYLTLLPFSPINRFLFTPSLLDSPSERVLRDEYLSELSHYGYGYYSRARDGATGLPAIDLYPIPVVAGLPIFVRYTAQHAITKNGTAWSINTIPEHHKRTFADLLLAQTLEEEADRLVKNRQIKAGINELVSDPKTMEARIDRLRERAYASLGRYVSAGYASHS